MEQLKWHEPAAYLRARAQDQRGASRPWSPIWLALLITGGLFTLFRVSELVRGTPSKMGVWAEFAIALGCGVVFGFVVPFLGSRASA